LLQDVLYTHSLIKEVLFFFKSNTKIEKKTEIITNDFESDGFTRLRAIRWMETESN